MTQYSKFNIIYLLQKWLDSVPGQTFMNYAYSWGASVVILGALFKLTHLPGANLMLFLGMGTEVLVFFIAGFDRPFDKTEDGKEIPTHMEGTILAGGGAVAPGLSVEGLEDGEVAEGEAQGSGQGGIVGGSGGIVGGGGGIVGGGTTIVGGGATGGTVILGGGNGTEGAAALTEEQLQQMQQQGTAGIVGGIGTGPAVIGGVQAPELPDIKEDMEEATTSYVEQLKKLTETLEKVSEQSERLTRDSEEMENLNRTLTGICKVYEMQLKGASRQIGTIDEINDQSRRMAEHIAELNRIYTRMIEAMTVNMPKGPMAPQNTEEA